MGEYRFACKIISIKGTEEALFGMGLSHGVTSSKICPLQEEELLEKLKLRAKKLYPLDGGHNKFLKFIQVYLDITAPRYWWQDFDTYGVGVSRQSESTMHTLTHHKLTQQDFVVDIPQQIIDLLNDLIGHYNQDKHALTEEQSRERFEEIKAILPEGFLQRRIVIASAMALKNIYEQRKDHRLKGFRCLCQAIKEGVLQDYEKSE